MARVIVKILVGICRFTVEVCKSNIEKHKKRKNIKKHKKQKHEHIKNIKKGKIKIKRLSYLLPPSIIEDHIAQMNSSSKAYILCPLVIIIK